MIDHTWLLLIIYLILLTILVKPLGLYIAAIINKKLNIYEIHILNLCGIHIEENMNWINYTIAILLFNALGFITLYSLQVLQQYLPFNPQNFVNLSFDSAINTAISFITNTNWQSYSGETTMSYFTQMFGLSVQNFLSAATGIAVAIVLIRGFTGHQVDNIGNAWLDLYRITIWLLLPLSFIFALFLISQGVIQNFKSYQTITTLEKATQVIAMGPVASQEAIKMIGTNGGGFFNVNSAHPYENPTPLTNFLQMISIFLIPGALCFTFGRMIGDMRQGWILYSTMTVIFIVFAIAVIKFEQQSNHLLTQINNQQSIININNGNIEGKEIRFGIADSALFAAITTAASCGAVNTMHDSFSPLGGAIPLALIQLGEVVFGGVGSGLYGILIYAILAVFIAGLMIGRTPEYLGKKIEAREMWMTSIAILIPPLLVLIGTAIAVMTTAGRAGIYNPGAHGFTEILYALSSAVNNNGSAFAGLAANTPFYNYLLAIMMLVGRFGIIIPVLVMAGSLAAKKRIPVSTGTLPTHGLLFMILLIITILLIGLINYVPALALGPIVEYLTIN